MVEEAEEVVDIPAFNDFAGLDAVGTDAAEGDAFVGRRELAEGSTMCAGGGPAFNGFGTGGLRDDVFDVNFEVRKSGDEVARPLLIGGEGLNVKGGKRRGERKRLNRIWSWRRGCAGSRLRGCRCG